AVREALRSADLTPGAGAGSWHVRARPGEERAILPTPPPAPAPSAPDPLRRAADAQAFVDYFRRAPPPPGPRVPYDPSRRARDPAGRPEAASTPRAGVGSGGDSGTISDLPASAVEAAPPPTSPATTPLAPDPGLLAAPRPAERLLQVHNSYVVTQDEQGV